MTETATDYACRQAGTDADLIEEIRDVLTRASRPLSMREIEARCALADGSASLLRPLRQMREAGDVVAIGPEREDGKRVYQLADDSRRAVAADDAAADDAQAPQPPDDIAIERSSPAPDAPSYRPGLRDQVRAAVAEMQGEFTGQDIAARTGLDAYRASKTLAVLAQTGELRRRKIDGHRYAYIVPDSTEAAEATGTDSPPGRAAARRARVREIAAAMPAPFTAADIAGASGEDTQRVSKALWDLAQLGELDRRKISGNRYAYFHPAGAGAKTAAAPQPPPALDTAARRQGLARYAYRSDGTLLIETAAGEACELDREETDRLYLYLTAIHRGLRASMTGSVTHG